jgi:hypothetical protein
MSDQQRNTMLEDICTAEAMILKVIDFELDVKTPYQHIKYFSECLFPLEKHTFGVTQNIAKIAVAVCNDSYYTPCNLIYHAPSVTLASIIFAATKLGLPLPFSLTTPNEDDEDEQTGASKKFDYMPIFEHLYWPTLR